MKAAKEKFGSMVRSGSKVKDEVRKKVAGYITAGFGLVAGLAWNDAIRSFIEELFPTAQNTIIAKFVYAFFITIVLVVISAYLVHMLKTEEQEKE